MQKIKVRGGTVTFYDRKPENVEETKRRFEICKQCEHVTQNGFGCKKWDGCCFGRHRAQPSAVCPDTPPKWGQVNQETKQEQS